MFKTKASREIFVFAFAFVFIMIWVDIFFVALTPLEWKEVLLANLLLILGLAWFMILAKAIGYWIERGE